VKDFFLHPWAKMRTSANNENTSEGSDLGKILYRLIDEVSRSQTGFEPGMVSTVESILEVKV
jgi:hypothetical protein